MIEKDVAARNWAIIRSSGCGHIQGVIEGKTMADFDLDMLAFMARFVLTSPVDTQAAPKVEKARDAK